MLNQNTIKSIKNKIPDEVELINANKERILFKIENGLNRGKFIRKIDIIMKELYSLEKQDNFTVYDNSLSSSSSKEGIIYEVNISKNNSENKSK